MNNSSLAFFVFFLQQIYFSLYVTNFLTLGHNEWAWKQCWVHVHESVVIKLWNKNLLGQTWITNMAISFRKTTLQSLIILIVHECFTLHFRKVNNMMTSSNGNIFRVTGPLCGEFTGHGDFPAQRPVTRSFDFSKICAWIDGCVNNREAGGLRRNRAHYDVIVMNTHRTIAALLTPCEGNPLFTDPRSSVDFPRWDVIHTTNQTTLRHRKTLPMHITYIRRQEVTIWDMLEINTGYNKSM